MNSTGLRQLNKTRIQQTAKAGLKHGGMFLGQGLALAALDMPFQALESYDNEQSEPNLGLTAMFSLPGLLMGGPAGLAAGWAISKIPEIPSLIRGTNNFLKQQDMVRRQSALPFGGYNWAPTAGAIESMNRGLSAMGSSSNLTSTHAGLASMALRR